MKYFAYGSNMSLSRLRERVPSARRIGRFSLREHSLKFHKIGQDGTAKCNALHTENPADCVFGSLFGINEEEKKYLDKAEGLGYGYNEKIVIVEDGLGNHFEAFTYYATQINNSLLPFSWYKNHVVIGAIESSLPEYYIMRIQSVAAIEDPDAERSLKQRMIHTHVSL